MTDDLYVRLVAHRPGLLSGVVYIYEGANTKIPMKL